MHGVVEHNVPESVTRMKIYRIVGKDGTIRYNKCVYEPVGEDRPKKGSMVMFYQTVGWEATIDVYPTDYSGKEILGVPHKTMRVKTDK